jgi:hypothetical protein
MVRGGTKGLLCLARLPDKDRRTKNPSCFAVQMTCEPVMGFEVAVSPPVPNRKSPPREGVRQAFRKEPKSDLEEEWAV